MKLRYGQSGSPRPAHAESTGAGCSMACMAPVPAKYVVSCWADKPCDRCLSLTVGSKLRVVNAGEAEPGPPDGSIGPGMEERDMDSTAIVEQVVRKGWVGADRSTLDELVSSGRSNRTTR